MSIRPFNIVPRVTEDLFVYLFLIFVDVSSNLLTLPSVISNLLSTSSPIFQILCFSVLESSS